MKKSIFLLIVLASVLPELLTGSSPLSSFFDPGHVIILLIGYGLAVLLLREIAVRNNLSLAGIYILGLAFGIYNEGLLAKTLIRATALPIAQYNNYGYFFDVSFPFTVAISFWHALASVLMPILITYWVYPKNVNVSWLNKKLTIVLTISLLILGSVSLLGKLVAQGTPLQLAILLGLMFICYLTARYFTKNQDVAKIPKQAGLKPMWLGASIVFPYFILLTYIAGMKYSLAIFFCVFIFIIISYFQILKRNGWLDSKNLILFGIGNYLQNTILGGLLGFTVLATLIERVTVSLVGVIFLIWFASKVNKDSNSLGKVEFTKTIAI